MNIVVLGAASGIAVEFERLYAARGAGFGLLGSTGATLDAIKADLQVRGAKTVETRALDLSGDVDHEAILREFSAKLGGIDAVLLAYGRLGDQVQAKDDIAQARSLLAVDFTSAALWLLAAAKVVDAKGAIVVISSVAGDRGRKSNYIYGAAKGGLALFAQGMAHDLAATGPRVITIKPGFVITPMTDGLKRGGPLWASAKTVAKVIAKAIDGKSGPIVYAPWFWRWIMLIIRLVPAPVFHKTNL